MPASIRKPVDPGTLPYRPCVGVMVLNGEGRVWVGRRIAEPDSEFAGTDMLWQMPQGGIDKGEEPIAAARREIFEETGMQSLDLLAEAPDWINYDLPRELVGIAFKGSGFYKNDSRGSSGSKGSSSSSDTSSSGSGDTSSSTSSDSGSSSSSASSDKASTSSSSS